MAKYLTGNVDFSQREQKRRATVEEGPKKTGVGLLTTLLGAPSHLFTCFSYYALNLAVLFVVQKLAFILLISQCVCHLGVKSPSSSCLVLEPIPV